MVISLFESNSEIIIFSPFSSYYPSRISDFLARTWPACRSPALLAFFGITWQIPENAEPVHWSTWGVLDD
jgi:hypothetical protein